MTVLDCSVTSCLHNSENCCCKGAIIVEGHEAKKVCDTCCGSFDEKRDSSFSNRYESPDTKLQVECEATKCAYNEQKRCEADHIGIAGSNATNANETECASFKSRD